VSIVCESLIIIIFSRGVDIFLRHWPNWRVVQNFHSPKQKTTGPLAQNIEMVSESLKKILARLAKG
jgi:hypothetical protein